MFNLFKTTASVFGRPDSDWVSFLLMIPRVEEMEEEQVEVDDEEDFDTANQEEAEVEPTVESNRDRITRWRAEAMEYRRKMLASEFGTRSVRAHQSIAIQKYLNIDNADSACFEWLSRACNVTDTARMLRHLLENEQGVCVCHLHRQLSYELEHGSLLRPATVVSDIDAIVARRQTARDARLARNGASRVDSSSVGLCKRASSCDLAALIESSIETDSDSDDTPTLCSSRSSICSFDSSAPGTPSIAWSRRSPPLLKQTFIAPSSPESFPVTIHADLLYEGSAVSGLGLLLGKKADVRAGLRRC